jgi:hypothetical protein
MYDSGFARLSGAGSRTGTFTNDSVGFGHWINLEVASRVPKDPSRSSKLVAALSKALDITGQKVSREVNAAFGLVSPRVLRVDAEHKLLFPPPPGDQYRIISFDSREVKHDTVVIRVGDWVDLGGSPGAGPKISGLDARDGNFMQRFGSGARNSRPGSARIVEKPAPQVFLTERSPKGLPASDGDNDPGAEPLQVQRIPLEPLQSSVVSSDYLAGVTPFRWQGAVASGFSPSARVFQLGTGESPVSEFTSPAHLLIPVMNNSYGQGRTKFVGVQMTAMLVNQITRLTDASHAQRDVSLLAEQDEQGRFFLRIFPAKAGEQRKPPSKR